MRAICTHARACAHIYSLFGVCDIVLLSEPRRSEGKFFRERSNDGEPTDFLRALWLGP